MSRWLCTLLTALMFTSQAQAQLADPAAAVHTAARAENRWSQSVSYLGTVPRQGRIGTVNALVNALRYQTDAESHGVEDKWDTPYELLARGAGDCEDFAIAKYFLLLESGLSKEQVKIGFVYYAADGVDATSSVTAGRATTHVVALVYAHPRDHDPMVLDLIPQIAPLSARRDLSLLFEFGVEGTSTSQAAHKVSAGAVAHMVAKWHAVLERMRLGRSREADIVARHTAPMSPRLTRALLHSGLAVR